MKNMKFDNAPKLFLILEAPIIFLLKVKYDILQSIKIFVSPRLLTSCYMCGLIPGSGHIFLYEADLLKYVVDFKLWYNFGFISKRSTHKSP